MQRNRSRRSLLTASGALGAAALAGCLDAAGSTRGATDVVLHNETDDRLRVGVTVTRRDGGTDSVDASVEMAPNSRRIINNEVVMGATYDVSIDVGESESGSAPAGESVTWEDAGRPLHVLLHDGIEFAVEIG